MNVVNWLLSKNVSIEAPGCLHCECYTECDAEFDRKEDSSVLIWSRCIMPYARDTPMLLIDYSTLERIPSARSTRPQNSCIQVSIGSGGDTKISFATTLKRFQRMIFVASCFAFGSVVSFRALYQCSRCSLSRGIKQE